MTMGKIVTNNHEVVTTEQEKKEGYIRDFISGEWVKDKPEEQVRQTYLRKLVEEYGYDPKKIKTEVSIKSGQTETKKPADIVVFDTSLKLSGKFCPHPKFAQKRNRRDKDNGCLS